MPGLVLHSEAPVADSDEAGHAFQIEAGHPFRFEAGHRSDLKSATWRAFRRVERMLFLFFDLGLVSRVTPVHTAMRNCTRDEGRPFEVGNQVLISSHRKLLWPKSVVVSVAETPGR